MAYNGPMTFASQNTEGRIARELLNCESYEALDQNIRALTQHQ